SVRLTARSRAAVWHRAISNWAWWWYTPDFTLFQPEWFRQPPFREPQEYASRSAITSVEKIRTPIAFILGEADGCPTPPPPPAPGGPPSQRTARLRALLGWMDQYSRGKDVGQFRDVMNAAEKQ